MVKFKINYNVANEIKEYIVTVIIIVIFGLAHNTNLYTHNKKQMQ